MNQEATACELLPWDSAHFGFPIARLQSRTLTETSAASVDAWCRNAGVRCLYFEAASEDPGTARLAGVQGYQLVDVRLYLERPLDDPDGIPEPVAELRAPHAEDVSVLEEIARKGFGLTRFYFDGRFPTERVAEMYAIWIRRSIAGWADAVLVSGSIGQPDGMVTCHLESAGGRIGLLGIDVRAREKGRGRDLLRGVLRWLSHEGVRLAMVATQARNAGAQRLYQRCGFVTTRTSVFYHKWYR